MRNIKEISIKNQTYYLLDDTINIKDFGSSLLKIDKKSYNGIAFKSINTYYIGYITIKHSKYADIHSVNPLHLIIGEADGSIEEKYGNNYLIFPDKDKNKEVLEKYKKLCDELKYHIKTINAGKEGEYGKDYMKIKFNSNDKLPLNKILKLHMLTIIVKSVFEDGKYYL